MYAAVRLSSASSGIACVRGRGTDDTMNVVAPARARIRARAGIGTSMVSGSDADGRPRPAAARLANGVVVPSTVISPAMPGPTLSTKSSPLGATSGKLGDGASSVACSTPGAVPMRKNGLRRSRRARANPRPSPARPSTRPPDVRPSDSGPLVSGRNAHAGLFATCVHCSKAASLRCCISTALVNDTAAVTRPVRPAASSAYVAGRMRPPRGSLQCLTVTSESANSAATSIAFALASSMSDVSTGMARGARASSARASGCGLRASASAGTATGTTTGARGSAAGTGVRRAGTGGGITGTASGITVAGAGSET